MTGYGGIYAYMDRATTDLDPAGQFLIRAMRMWVVATRSRYGSSGGTAVGAGGHFAAQGILEALPFFHGAMTVLDRHALFNLSFGCPRSASVSEGEALFLALLAQVEQRDDAWVGETLSLLVERSQGAALAGALHALANRLAARNLLPGAPAALESRTGPTPGDTH